MALAHSARIHVEGTDVAASRVIVCACARFCGCGDRVTNRIEPRIMISLSDVFKPNRTVGWYLKEAGWECYGSRGKRPARFFLMDS